MSFYTDTVEDIFKRDGILVKDFKMEYRPQQKRLALAIAKNFESDNPLLAEAGTGVGKSLAYLIPGIIWSVMTGRKFIVATHTKNLQDQLIQKDLPFVRTIFKSRPEYYTYAKFSEMLLVGKGNYLCTNRLKDAIIRFNQAGDSDTVDQLYAIKSETNNPKFDGLRDHLPVDVADSIWSEINAESSLCNYKRCFDSDCYYHIAKRQIDNADIIIANHSLVFSLIGSNNNKSPDTKGILFENDFVVFDEGHKICEVATEFFGNDISSKECEHILNSLITNCKSGFPFEKLNVEKVRSLVDNAKSSLNGFFSRVKKKCFNKTDDTYKYLRKPDWIENSCKGSLNELISYINSEVSELNDSTASTTATDILNKVKNINGFIDEIISLENRPLFVYWVEYNERSKTIKLLARPIDVSEFLSYFLFCREVSVVVASATLTDETKTMQRFIECSGAALNGATPEKIIETSPFDYERNMEVFIASDCPDFSLDNNEANVLYNAKVIYHAAQAIEGGTIVLCTSYKQCNEIGELVEAKLDGERNVYIQGRDYKRSEMVRRFKKDGNAILFGTSSFWTGVDIPGKALSQIIIVKMPFINPEFPLTKAKGEVLEENGRSAFFDLLVPEAIMQFRQGLGRLIRSGSDKGRLIITDTRLVNKTYGRSFFSVIPSNNRKRFSKSNFKSIITETTI